VKMPYSREHKTRASFPHARLAGVLILAAAMIQAAWSQFTPRDTVPAPFASGERLVYHVEWTPPLWLFFLPAMEAGEATLTLAGETQYKDKKALKIIFTARSSGALARFTGKNIDDSYEFTTDPETFCTYRVSEMEREGKRMRDINVLPARHPSGPYKGSRCIGPDSKSTSRQGLRRNTPRCEGPFLSLVCLATNGSCRQFVAPGVGRF